MYVLVVLTTTGKMCESHPTYEEAQQRLAALPAECLLSTPMIFQELPDGSQRLVREDGKPLQIHRMPYDEPDEGEPIPLGEDIPLGPVVQRHVEWEVEDEPIRLEDLFGENPEP